MKTKLFLIGLISVVLCICLTGCGAEDTTKTQEEISTQINNLIDQLFEEDTNEVENNVVEPVTVDTDKETTVTSNPLGLYSDDTHIVFMEDDTYFVFTYSGDEITGYTAYVVCESEAVAKAGLEEYNLDPDEDVKKAYVDGNNVVIEYAESVYEDLTVSMVKLAYSYLDEVTK